MADFNVRVLGVLMNDDGEVLLLKRAPNPASKEHIGWEFCGGGVEHNETPEDALVREYKEEAGVTVEPMQIFNARTGTREGKPLLNLAYLCRLVSGKVKLTAEHTEATWIAIEDLADHDLGPHVNIDRDAFLAISTGSGMIESD